MARKMVNFWNKNLLKMAWIGLFIPPLCPLITQKFWQRANWGLKSPNGMNYLTKLLKLKTWSWLRFRARMAKLPPLAWWFGCSNSLAFRWAGRLVRLWVSAKAAFLIPGVSFLCMKRMNLTATFCTFRRLWAWLLLLTTTTPTSIKPKLNIWRRLTNSLNRAIL